MLDATGLTLWDLQSLILKHMFQRRVASGREISEHLGLPWSVVEPALTALQKDRMLEYRGTVVLGDFLYGILDEGIRQAREMISVCSYAGAAPVPLEDYVQSMVRQSVGQAPPSCEALRAALADLVVDVRLFEVVGQALTAGRSLFLYGAPGNGKTSIAERVMRAYGDYIWIPKAIELGRTVLRLFDPRYHVVVDVPFGGNRTAVTDFDHRWVPIRRPTIVVGGELTLQHLEVSESAAGVYEAPVQLKSNGGALVVDDFGRQRVNPQDLLNRWILPLERHFDILNLPNGRSVQVPFDQLTIFSTNLDPSDLVDEAFLRRIPYKAEVSNPTEEGFFKLLQACCKSRGIDYHQQAAENLLQRHFREAKRPLRYCHPRDLVQLVYTECQFLGRPLELTVDALESAVSTYFSTVKPRAAGSGSGEAFRDK